MELILKYNKKEKHLIQYPFKKKKAKGKLKRFKLPNFLFQSLGYYGLLNNWLLSWKHMPLNIYERRRFIYMVNINKKKNVCNIKTQTTVK